MQAIIVKILIVCIATLFYSCDRQIQEVMGQETVSTSLDLLLQHINIHIPPNKVQWSIKKKGENGLGPSDSDVTIILTYSPENMKKVREEFKGQEDIRRKIYMNKDFIKSWFTPSIKNSFYQEEQYYRVGTVAYFPMEFLISPFAEGFCFFTTDNRVFIYLYTN